jgi:hypothetical protein
MLQEISKLYIELPGDTIAGSMTVKNMILLHEHRDVIIKLDFPAQSSFRLVSREKPFYDPKIQHQRTEYPFSSGEEIHIWLSKFHESKLVVEKQTQEGWKQYIVIDPLEFDGTKYLHRLARPAPIIIKAGPQGGPIGTTVTLPRAETTIPSNYRSELYQMHQSTTDQEESAEEGTTQTAALLRMWEVNKFPSMSREVGTHMLQAHQSEPESLCVVEIQRGTELYNWLPDNDTVIPYDAELWGMWRLVVDALIATLGKVAEESKLARDLIGVKFDVEVKKICGVVKKFIIFKGYAGLRPYLNAAKYGIANVKVVTLTARHMTMGELAAQSAQNVRQPFVAGWSVPRKVLVIGLLADSFQWLTEGNQDMERLVAKWSVTLVGTVITSALAPFIAAGVGQILAKVSGVAVGTAIPGIGILIAVGVVVIFVGFAIGYALDSIGAEDAFYNLYKTLRDALMGDLAIIGYDDDCNGMLERSYQ